MEDFENIVYLLAAVGWLIWKAFRRASDKNTLPESLERPRAGAQGEVKPLASTLDGMLEQFGMETKKDPVSSRPVKSMRGQSRIRNKGFLNTDLTHSHLADDYEMSAGEMQSHRVERQVRVLETRSEETGTLSETILQDGFDLRQAVVLNAVLNRPYG